MLDENTIEIFKEAINTYDLEKLEKYLNYNEVDESILDIALQFQNFHAFSLIHSKVEISDKNRYIQKAMGCLPIALFLLETHANYYESQNSFYFDNAVMNTMFFNEDSIIERYYEKIAYKNDKESFLGKIMNNALDPYKLNDTNFEVLNYLLNNRDILNIKDEDIIQYMTEGEYQLNNSSAFDKNKSPKSIIKDNFITIVEAVVNAGISLKHDSEGYLIQIAVFNNLDNIISTLYEAGSNLNKFLDRVSNKNNWLTDEQEEDLGEEDYNNERCYDIYKKFDETHNFNENNLKTCYIVKRHSELNEKIPDKSEVDTKKRKI